MKAVSWESAWSDARILARTLWWNKEKYMWLILCDFWALNVSKFKNEQNASNYDVINMTIIFMINNYCSLKKKWLTNGLNTSHDLIVTVSRNLCKLLVNFRQKRAFSTVTAQLISAIWDILYLEFTALCWQQGYELLSRRSKKCRAVW